MAQIESANGRLTPRLTFDGTLQAGDKGGTILKLDDGRFLILSFKTSSMNGLPAGARVRVQSGKYDGNALVVDAARALPAGAPANGRRTLSPDAPAREPSVSGSDIEQARKTAAEMMKSLPDFLCRQIVKRHQWNSHQNGWQMLDTLSAEVRYGPGQVESYGDVKVNGVPNEKPWLELGGDLSMGEFGSLLRGLFFLPDSDFRFVKNARLDRVPAREYDFHASPAQSGWKIICGFQFIRSGYGGRVWFAAGSWRVLRIEMKTENIPRAFPISSVETEVVYGVVSLGSSGSYLLPVHASSESVYRSEARSRQSIDFRDYRKFTGESKIIF